MKKIIVLTLSVIIFAVALGLFFFGQKPSETAQETAGDISSEQQTDITDTATESTEEAVSENMTSEISGAHSLLTVDSWLRICSVEKTDGKISVVAENLSEDNVEYALLTLKTKETELTFNISALLSGEKMYLFSNEEYSADISDSIIFGKTENILLYPEALSLNEDIFEIAVKNGTFSVKNVSDTDITSEIVIYYKELINNIPNGSITGRIRIDGLAAGAVTYVKKDGLNTVDYRIIFTEYDKEI